MNVLRISEPLRYAAEANKRAVELERSGCAVFDIAAIATNPITYFVRYWTHIDQPGEDGDSDPLNDNDEYQFGETDDVAADHDR